MKKRIILTAVICAVVLAAVSLLSGFWNDPQNVKVLKVGFVYSEDESTPYTANFVKAQHALEEEYGGKVEILVKSNVLSRESEQPIRDLIRDGGNSRKYSSARRPCRPSVLRGRRRIITLSTERYTRHGTSAGSPRA